MAEINFTVEDTETKGRIVARVSGFDDVGELTFSKASEALVIVDHTGVPDALKGQGVGTALAGQMVELARERRYKTVPLCPFYKAALARHPEWADVAA